MLIRCSRPTATGRPRDADRRDVGPISPTSDASTLLCGGRTRRDADIELGEFLRLGALTCRRRSSCDGPSMVMLKVERCARSSGSSKTPGRPRSPRPRRTCRRCRHHPAARLRAQAEAWRGQHGTPCSAVRTRIRWRRAAAARDLRAAAEELLAEAQARSDARRTRNPPRPARARGRRGRRGMDVLVLARDGTTPPRRGASARLRASSSTTPVPGPADLAGRDTAVTTIRTTDSPPPRR